MTYFAMAALQEAECEVREFRFMNLELMENRKWRKIKDTAMLLVSMIDSTVSRQLSLRSLVMRPTYTESEHRHTVLEILVSIVR